MDSDILRDSIVLLVKLPRRPLDTYQFALVAMHYSFIFAIHSLLYQIRPVRIPRSFHSRPFASKKVGFHGKSDVYREVRCDFIDSTRVLF